MQPLPNPFITSSNDSAASEDGDAESLNFEPINAGKRESASRYTPSVMPASIVIVIAVLVSFMISVTLIIATTDKPMVRIASLFGQKLKPSDESDPQQIAIDQLNTLVAQHSEFMTTMNSSVQSLRDELATIKNSLTENESHITELKGRFDDTASDVNKIKIQLAKPKSVAVVKPKVPPKPQVYVSLVSIRSQGGNEWVTLRDGMYVSPLMAMGDEWHSVKLVAADTNNRSAQILVNGTVAVVKL